MKDSNKEGSRDNLKLDSVEPISPYSETLYEIGKGMVKSSILITQDFCKFMINVSLGAIPIYLGLLKFVLPNTTKLPMVKLSMAIFPPFIFIISATVFILGYFPKIGNFSLEIIDEIKLAYTEVVHTRRKFIFWGTVLFFFGIILALISVLVNIMELD